MELAVLVDVESGLDAGGVVEAARACERAGIGAFFLSDHLASRAAPAVGGLDPWALAAAIGTVTTTLRVGTMMSPVTFRHPAVLARAVWTVHQLTGGRCEVGVGTGSDPGEHERFGVPFPPLSTRQDLLDEQLEILDGLLTATPDAFSFTGRHHRLTGCPTSPVGPGRPRRIVGKRAHPRSLRAAARWADEYNLTFVDPAGARAAAQHVRASVRELGRTEGLRVSVLTDCVVGESWNDVRGLLRAAPPAAAWVAGEVVRGEASRVLAGDVAAVARRLGAYAEAGVDRLVLKPSPEQVLPSVELLAASARTGGLL